MVRYGISLLALAIAAPAVAETPRALVIGVPDASAPMAFADSYNVAQALRSAGFTEVTLLRDASLTEIRRTWDQVDPDLLYMSGPFPTAIDGRLEGDDRPDILLLDDCAAPIAVSGTGVATASGAGLCGNGGIAALMSRATSAQIARDFNGVLATAWSAEPPEAFEVETAAVATTTTGPVAVGVEAVVAVSPVTPISAVAQSAGSALTGTAPEGVEDDAEVAVFLSTPSSQLAAVPTRSGFPEPSIILGVIAPTLASFPTAGDDQAGQEAQAAELAGAEISYQNLEARRALKESDPQLFETLVSGGAFDPPDVELATALQTELQRMGCYRSRIDGLWGNGSRGAAQRYWDQLDESGPVDPEIELFRQIMRKDDVICPAPAVAARPRATSSGNTTRRTTTAARPTQTRSAPARTQPQQPARTRTLRGSGSLLGTFR